MTFFDRHDIAIGRLGAATTVVAFWSVLYLLMGGRALVLAIVLAMIAVCAVEGCATLVELWLTRTRR